MDDLRGEIEEFKRPRRVCIKNREALIQLMISKLIPSDFLDNIAEEANGWHATILNSILENKIGEALRDAERLLQLMGARRVLFKVFFLRGLAYYTELLFDSAIKAWDNSLRYFETPHEKVTILKNEGLCYLRRGDVDKSIELFRESLEACSNNKIEDSYYAETLCLLGDSYITKGIANKAEEMYNMAMKVSKKTESVEVEMHASLGLSRVHLFKGEYYSTFRYLTRIQDLWEEYDDMPPEYRVNTSLLKGEVYRNLKQRDNALTSLWEGIKLIENYHGIDSSMREYLKWYSLHSMCEAALKDGNLVEAKHSEEEALRIAENAHDKIGICKSYIMLARLTATQGQNPINYILDSLNLAREANSFEILASVYEQLGDYYRELYPQRSLSSYNLSIAFYKSIKYKIGEERVKEKMGWTKKEVEKPSLEENAERFIQAAREILPSVEFIESKIHARGRKPYNDRILVLACMLKMYLRISYRRTEKLFRENERIREMVGFENIPDHNTLQRAGKRYGEVYLSELLKPIMNVLE
jgi:tetratricopeptide (TPR) repeat protein